jgi:hypothetical protein
MAKKDNKGNAGFSIVHCFSLKPLGVFRVPYGSKEPVSQPDYHYLVLGGTSLFEVMRALLIIESFPVQDLLPAFFNSGFSGFRLFGCRKMQ